MSPPVPSLDNEQAQALVKDGLVASIIGAMAMTARLLMSTEQVGFLWVVRRVAAAAVTACLVGYGIQDYIQSPGLKMAVVGACGYCAPEATDTVLKYIKARGQLEVNKVSKGIKPNGKNKTSKDKQRKRR